MPRAKASQPRRTAPGGAPRKGPAFKSPRYIAVEGPIRVGKSTLAKILADRLHARRVFDCEDNPFLADFYSEKPGAAFRAQMYFLLERQRCLREAQAIEAPGAIVADFLLEKDKIFAYLNLDNEELELYERYFEILSDGLPAPDLVIYLQASPEVLRSRIVKKAASAEAQNLPRLSRRGHPRLRAFLLPIFDLGAAGGEHLGD